MDVNTLTFSIQSCVEIGWHGPFVGIQLKIFMKSWIYNQSCFCLRMVHHFHCPISNIRSRFQLPMDHCTGGFVASVSAGPAATGASAGFASSPMSYAGGKSPLAKIAKREANASPKTLLLGLELCWQPAFAQSHPFVAGNIFKLLKRAQDMRRFSAGSADTDFQAFAMSGCTTNHSRRCAPSSPTPSSE